ncbi:MAG: TetR/AcrR family transcriptional regulator [Firmicutes bacterium]|nr:TetR/AcrR family transcriptional regulator [Bacillota bacterium]
MIDNIREPKQQRAIEKKEKIIESGFNLICENGYYNTNTAEIAKAAGVSTGIVYQYFKDKYDILIEGLEKYGDDIFFPMLKNKDIKFDKKDFDKLLNKMINHYISNHKVSNVAHEEIMSMVHSDKRVAEYYYKRELEMTNSLKNILLDNGFDKNDLTEKVHIMMGLIDNLCHEVTYHKHSDMNYNIMTALVIENIKTLFKNDLV